MTDKVWDACAQIGSGDRKGDVLESAITTERILQNMDAAGVSRSVVSPVTWNQYGEKSNREIAEAVDKHPARFIGLARANPTAKDGLKLLEKALQWNGISGIRLRPFQDKFTLSDPSVSKAFALATERKVPIAVDGEKNMDALVALVKKHTQVPIILMHLGDFGNWVWQNGKAYMDMLGTHPHFYMATCFEIIHFFLEEAIRRAPRKVVFGSDSPSLPPSMELKKIEVMGLPEEDFAGVVGRNLFQIFG
jgi:predicted TIM-barrel fold metal-dependent hydrolase